MFRFTNLARHTGFLSDVCEIGSRKFWYLFKQTALKLIPVRLVDPQKKAISLVGLKQVGVTTKDVFVVSWNVQSHWGEERKVVEPCLLLLSVYITVHTLCSLFVGKCSPSTRRKGRIHSCVGCLSRRKKTCCNDCFWRCTKDWSFLGKHSVKALRANQQKN